MKVSAHCAVVLFLFFGIVKLGLAQSLWGSTTYGMTLPQVQKVVSHAHAPTSNPDALASGEKELLRLDGVKISGDIFHAGFFFLGDTLTHVYLTLDNPPPFSQAIITYKSVANALRAKYGHELGEEDTPAGIPGFAHINQMHWLSGRTNIKLVIVGIQDSPASLTIMYETELAKDADKL